jgi:hypothetical protein
LSFFEFSIHRFGLGNFRTSAPATFFSLSFRSTALRFFFCSNC